MPPDVCVCSHNEEPHEASAHGRRLTRHAPRRRWQGLLVAALLLQGSSPRTGIAGAQELRRLQIEEQVTFLYFNDLSRAAGFYGRILALPQTLDLDWVKIFRISPTSSIGLVDAEHGAHRPSDVKPVMVSLVVDDVDAWYQFLTERGVEPDGPPTDSDRVNTRGFGFRDPEGHTLEVFAWRNGPPGMTPRRQ